MKYEDVLLELEFIKTNDSFIKKSTHGSFIIKTNDIYKMIFKPIIPFGVDNYVISLNLKFDDHNYNDDIDRKYLIGDITKAINSYEEIFSYLERYPKYSEYQYLFGEVSDCGFNMEVNAGFYEDIDDPWNGKMSKDSSNTIFKVCLIFTRSSYDIDLELVKDSLSEVRHCIERLSSYDKIYASYYEMEEGEYFDIYINLNLVENKSE